MPTPERPEGAPPAPAMTATGAYWSCRRCGLSLPSSKRAIGGPVTCPRCGKGILARLVCLVRCWWDEFSSPGSWDADYNLYIARCEVQDWWRSRIYARERCCGVTHLLGFTFGRHAEDCDDLPF